MGGYHRVMKNVSQYDITILNVYAHSNRSKIHEKITDRLKEEMDTSI